MTELPPCLGCGRCCTLLVEIVGGIDDVPDELLLGVYMRRVNGKCVALTPERTCSIYDNRPLECRQFKRGCQHCRELFA